MRDVDLGLMDDDREEVVVLDLNAGIAAEQDLDGHGKGKDQQEDVLIDCKEVDSDVAVDEGSRDVVREVLESDRCRIVKGEDSEQNDCGAT